MKEFIKKMLFQVNYGANTLFRKNNNVLICEPWNIESNCVEVANYLAEHYGRRVFYAVPRRLMALAEKLVGPGVEVVENGSLQFKYLFLTSKYIFAAHWEFPKFYTKKTGCCKSLAWCGA
jgi:hypothetical protein